MHQSARDFTLYVKFILTTYFKNCKVLDVGGGDINGNNRFLFKNCEYHCNDVGEAPNVTIVSKTKDLKFEDNTFDTIISTECFEHDPEYVESFKSIYRMLKPNGLFLFTCASIRRYEHGTRRTSIKDSYGSIYDLEDMRDYYKNLSIYDIQQIQDLDEIFLYWNSYYNSDSSDLYFFGIKKSSINNINYNVNSFPKYENNINIFMHNNSNIFNELSNVFLNYKTDKNSTFHNYCRQYENIFRHYKNKNNFKILELGVDKGQSLLCYSDYFKNYGTIVGVDINPNCTVINNKNKNINIEILDLSKKDEYQKLVNKYQSFDIIIDDASHINTDMIKSFENLFPILNDNGVYIIEDTICYKSKSHNDSEKPNILEYIFQYTKYLNQWRYDSDTGIKDHCIDPFKIQKKTDNVFEYSIDKIEYGCSYIAIYKKIRYHWIKN